MKAATILDDGLTLTADISIHAAREGGDATVASAFADAFCISIHAAREGGDVGNAVFVPTVIKFQSTPPVKAATINFILLEVALIYFNPRRP